MNDATKDPGGRCRIRRDLRSKTTQAILTTEGHGKQKFRQHGDSRRCGQQEDRPLTVFRAELVRTPCISEMPCDCCCRVSSHHGSLGPKSTRHTIVGIMLLDEFPDNPFAGSVAAKMEDWGVLFSVEALNGVAQSTL